MQIILVTHADTFFSALRNANTLLLENTCATLTVRGIKIFRNNSSLRKQLKFREVATCPVAKRHLSNERRDSILMAWTTQISVVLLIG